ncbi:FAD-dependent oxidoreductase [Actinokineospora sp. HUAS TT18]|uniref:FAD-dependent oxidoreductase n=1 Tax=Actinokineospora sp. HUAS TT18 TaxID=3447451 RepID=UPI003F5228FF
MSDERPVIAVVGGPGVREAMAAELRNRYDNDYAITTFTDAADARSRIKPLVKAGRRVAMFAAAPELPDDDGLALLKDAHLYFPSAKRVCLVPADQFLRNTEPLREAVADGHLDAYLVLPRGPRDEEFHSAITDLLSDWGWSTNTPEVDGIQIVADETTSELARLIDFLQRMGFPHRRYTSDTDIGREIAQAAPAPAQPLVRVKDDKVLSRPTFADLGALIYGQVGDLTTVADLAVIGSGPAGLAAAVYGASEGLSTVVIESEAIGGQAGTSSMIRNYLGFPRGISGMRLAQRARMQATRFGARMFVGRPVTKLVPGQPHTVVLDDGSEVRARAIVVATGAAYRRLGVEPIEDLVGRGVHYGAATSVARDCAGKRVYVVGGGNSAGQAALHLTRFAKSVTILIRRDSLAATMSDYLIREIAANPRVTVRPHTEVVDGGGDGALAWLGLRTQGVSETVDCDTLMLLLGAEPCVQWLPAEVAQDDHGFVLAGRDIPAERWSGGVPPAALATTVPGVFAVGDVRSGSMKRVASASGEGAAVVPLVHDYLG